MLAPEKIIIRVPIVKVKLDGADELSVHSFKPTIEGEGPVISRKPLVNQKSEAEMHTRVRQTRVSDKIKELVAVFASEHLNDHRTVFKNAWNQWIVSGEITSLLDKEYGDKRTLYEEKLFFSARYYHRKRALKEEESDCQTNVAICDQTSRLSRSSSIETTKEDEKTPRQYNKMDREILQSIDEHLATLPCDFNGFQIKPSKAFDDFVSIKPPAYYDNIVNKLKKTYKNRFYMKEKHIKTEVRNKQ